MNRMTQLLREKTNWLHLTLALVLTLAFLVGFWFMFFILAWGHFGEGANSKFYSQWTGKGIITAASLSIELILFLFYKNSINANNQSEAKSYLISGITVFVVFVVAIIFLGH